jgi:hypothetical protein
LCLDAERAAYFNVATPNFLSLVRSRSRALFARNTVSLQDVEPAPASWLQKLAKAIPDCDRITHRFSQRIATFARRPLCVKMPRTS